MRRRPVGTTPVGQNADDASSAEGKERPHRNEEGIATRPATLWLSLFVLLLNGAWAVYHVQFERLPAPLTAEQAGKRGFSEERAMEHVKALTGFGPRPVGSDALDLALQYVLTSAENIKTSAHWEVDVQVDFFYTRSGANRLSGGLFRGKTHIYSDMKHVVMRIVPKYLREEEENVILVSSHVDTVFSTEGAGDCSSCIAVMLELARGISQWAHGFKSGVIFLFNTGEEEGLNGAHSFITQHPWRHTVRSVVDLEAMGIGGKSSIFQIGSDSWAIENYAKVAKHPAAQIISEDLFHSGLIKSATDFQVYSEVAGLSGLDFVYTDNSAVYHTKNDKLALLKPGSLQHLGDNMLAFLLHVSMSSSKEKATQLTGHNHAVYFDILGKYMIVYRKHLAKLLQNSAILQALLIWMTSLFIGGFPAVVALALSLLSIILMWIFSLSLSVPVAFILPYICTHPVPFIANPWLVVGLFGAPAVVGALLGQHLGFLILKKYMFHPALTKNPFLVVSSDSMNLEAERWLYKAGLLQWQIILVMGSFFNAGSSYIALAWLICPAFAYGMIEATLTPGRAAKRLRIITLLLGLSIPVLISGGIFIRLVSILIGGIVRIDRNPGSSPAWLGNVIVSVAIVAVVCLTFVYLLSYIHLSGAKRPLTILMSVIFSLTLAAVSSDVFPSFSYDVARGVNVVHVVDATERYANHAGPVSYVSIFSSTPGRLRNEMDSLKDEQFSCGKGSKLDFVTFTVNYDCKSTINCDAGWAESEIPTFHVESDSIEEIRKTEVLMDTKISTRWSLAVNTELIRDFTFQVNSESNISILVENKKENDGWHVIQFAGGKNSPTKFTLMLYWSKSSTYSTAETFKQENSLFLLKLRTDVDRITPKTDRVLKLLPQWCSLFGKSTSPYTLAFLANLPVAF